MNFPQLTSTRFFAAIAIVIYHIAVFDGHVFPFNHHSLHQVFGFAYLGVNYFFVLSGFIMVIVYGKRTVAKGKYWFTRWGRVYPVYFLALLLSVVLGYTMQPEGMEKITLSDYLLNIFLLQSWQQGAGYILNAPGWTLSVEALFYLSFPFLLPLFQRLGLRKIILLTLAIWVISLAVQFGFLWQKDTFFTLGIFKIGESLPLNHLNTFVFGMALGFIFLEKKTETFKATWLSLCGMCGISIIGFYIAHDQQPLVRSGLLNPIFSLIIIYLACYKNQLNAWLWQPFFVWLGEISYALYILQGPVYMLAYALFTALNWQNPSLKFYSYVLILIGVSAVSYHWLETPMRDWVKKRIAAFGMRNAE